MKIIGINAPPRAGKDTAARIIAGSAKCSVKVLSLSMPMRMAVYGLLGHKHSNEHYEQHKDTPLEFGGYTTSIRQLMIGLSEAWIKPAFGHAAWVNLLLLQARGISGCAGADVIVIPDLGFQSEVRALTQAVGAENFTILQIHRPGRDFSEDSREWCYHEEHPVATVDNDHSLGTFESRVHGFTDRLIAAGWPL